MNPSRKAACPAVLLFATVSIAAQSLGFQGEPEAGLVALHQACLDASTDAVVLNIAAHPDDESSRTNTMLRRKYGMRVVAAYTTYGDGGQNAIGREIGPELAGLRVHETLRAAAMSGVEVRWLGMPDFGFSKTLEETLKVWGEERLRSAMRELVDRVDPDIVFTNHSIDQGHGHHRASFWAISEVLKERAAKGLHVPPLYSRCSVQKAQLTLDPAELDPLRGDTYARLAHRAWTQHVTQGPWGPHNPLQVGKDWWHIVLPQDTPNEAAADLFHWVRPNPDGDRLPDDAAWSPRAELARTAKALLEQARGRSKALSSRGDAPGGARESAVLQRRIDALERVLLAIANVRAEVWLDSDDVPLGGEGKVFVLLHGVEQLTAVSVSCNGVAGSPVQAAVRATPFDGMPAPPAGTAPTNGTAAEAPEAPEAPENPKAPKPSRRPMYPGRFSVPFACEGGPKSELPDGPEPRFVDVEISFELDGTAFTLRPSLAYTPVAAIELQWDREVVMVPKGQTVERLLSVSATSHVEAERTAPVRLSMGSGIQATAIPGRFTLSREHNEARILVRTTFQADELGADAGIEVGFGEQKARLRVQVVDVSVPPGLKVGLVRGPDDTTERTLADLGVAFQALDRDTLLTVRLEEFTTLLLDIRAYHHRPELAEVRDRILQFCRSGGRVVAMYHKSNEWNEHAGHPLLAPFPMTIGNDRVTEEDAAVTLLQPTHRLMQYPHVIEAADFAGWVQERGLNYPKTWDPAWTPMLEMRDSGDEKPHQGALLHTQYGRGDFVYCSLALYRQLRVGNAGAARLLINLLAK